MNSEAYISLIGSKITHKQKNCTPIKPLESSSMTHEEEKMEHDISKLRDQVQQIYLSQRERKDDMDGLKGNADVLKGNMEGLKDNMKCLKEVLKANMKGLKEGVNFFLEKRLPNYDKVVHETHDENKRNLNHGFRNSNFGLKSNQIPNIYMRKFYGKDMVTWILQMDLGRYRYHTKRSWKIQIPNKMVVDIVT